MKDVRCFSCGKMGHKALECRKKDVEDNDVGTIEEIAEEMEKLWVMGVTCEVDGQVATVSEDKFMWVSIDSGSDADGCPISFGDAKGDVANPSKVSLTTATHTSIEDMGERNVGMAFVDEQGGEVMATNKFRLGDFSKPVLSCGLRVLRGEVRR